MHAGHVGNKAGGVGERHHLDHGLRAVDELDEHPGVHVAPRGFLLIVGRNGVELQRVVLALAGGDDGIAEAPGEVHDFHGGAWLVAGAERIDDAGALRLLHQVGADRDVRLDVHHHDMLSVLHRQDGEFGTDARVARGIDDDINLLCGAGKRAVCHDGRLAGADRVLDVTELAADLGTFPRPVCDVDRMYRRALADFGQYSQLHPGHKGQLRDDVGPHLAGADNSNPYRIGCLRASKKTLRNAHYFLPKD